MNCKKGAIGSFTVMWVSTIAIIIILTIFIIGSGFVKKASDANKGVSILGEDKVGLSNIESYFNNNYSKFREVKHLVAGGHDLDSALTGANYEK